MGSSEQSIRSKVQAQKDSLQQILHQYSVDEESRIRDQSSDRQVRSLPLALGHQGSLDLNTGLVNDRSAE